MSLCDNRRSLSALAVLSLALVFISSVEAYNDEEPYYKWAPQVGEKSLGKTQFPTRWTGAFFVGHFENLFFPGRRKMFDLLFCANETIFPTIL